MATIALTDAYISFGTAGVIDADSNQVSLTYSAEVLDDTAFGDSTRSSKGGLKNWSADVTIIQNFAASAIDSKLFPLVGTTATLAIRPTSSAKGGSNPEYTGTALFADYNIVGNSVGELAQATISFRSAGDLSRSTS